MSISILQVPGRAGLDLRPATSAMRVPRELEIALNGPIGPHRVADDTVVVDEGGWYRTLTPSSCYPASNEVLFSNLNEHNADEQIDELVSEYHKLSLPVTWCVYPWTRPGDLGARLVARGGTPTSILAFLCSTDHPLELVEGVDIEHVDPDSNAFDIYIDVMSSGNELPAGEKEFRRRRYYELSSGPGPAMHLFIARCNGIVVGCHAIVVKEDSGHMTGAYVMPAYRAYGVFQSLIAACLRVLHDLKISIASGHSNEHSAFWVKRFGFKTIYSYDIYQLDPPPVVE